MADAAYQTIQTLQELLDVKSEAVRKKEDIILKLRNQMQQQREIDANTITELQQQLSITGNTTLGKLHDIVARETNRATPASSQPAARNQWDTKATKEI